MKHQFNNHPWKRIPLSELQNPVEGFQHSKTTQNPRIATVKERRFYLHYPYPKPVHLRADRPPESMTSPTQKKMSLWLPQNFGMLPETHFNLMSPRAGNLYDQLIWGKLRKGVWVHSNWYVGLNNWSMDPTSQPKYAPAVGAHLCSSHPHRWCLYLWISAAGRNVSIQCNSVGLGESTQP